MEEEETCNLVLGLGLGRVEVMPRPDLRQEHKRPVQFHLLFPKEEILIEEERGVKRSKSKTINADEEERIKNIINTTRDNHSNSNSNSTDNNNNGMRKKLKLTKLQSTLLEDSFKAHNTLNSMQKQELAEQLNLKPRQVEVWFQNRRARTKLKQTEVDCEFLKKYCQNLSEENKRLKKELQEMRSMKLRMSQFYVQLPKAVAISKCPSCNTISKTSKIENKNTTVLEAVGKSDLCSAFDNSSLTC